MTCNSCEKCIAPEGWVCKDSGNFYTTGEYSRTIDYFDIHGVSFEQKVDSIKSLLDTNTIQILKVLLTESDAPAKMDLETSLNIVHTLDFIQSRLSNHMDDKEPASSEINSIISNKGVNDV